MTSLVLLIVPWALFGVMVVFGTIFAMVSWRASKRASAAEDRLARMEAALSSTEQRAQHAESQIEQADARARAAEARIAEAERRAEQARDTARAAELRAEDMERRADGALAEAQRADSQLQARRMEAQDKARKAEQRAQSLLEWAKQQWETRREPDRQKAQGLQGSFQAQLDAFLSYRREPISFRVESEIDRLAAPLIERFAKGETIEVRGDEIRVGFPVDASQGFRA